MGMVLGDVHLQLALLFVPLATILTNEWLLTRVNANVHFKCRFGSPALITVWTDVLTTRRVAAPLIGANYN